MEGYSYSLYRKTYFTSEEDRANIESHKRLMRMLDYRTENLDSTCTQLYEATKHLASLEEETTVEDGWFDKLLKTVFK